MALVMAKLILTTSCMLTLFGFSYQTNFQINRTIFSPDSSVRIQTSQDTFTNLDPSAKKSCSSYQQSYCVGDGCSECKCFYNTNFYSLYDGCLTHTEIFARSTKEPRCDFGFANFQSPSAVPTLIDADDLYTYPKEVSWSPVQRSPPFTLQSSVNNIKCTTGSMYYIDRLGKIVLFYNNTKNDAFEVEAISKKMSWFTGETRYFFQLKWKQVSTKLWDTMRGKMIRLMVTCQRTNPILVVHSCILMKVSGSEVIDLSATTPPPTEAPLVETTGSLAIIRTSVPPSGQPTTKEGNATVGITRDKESSFPGATIAIGIAAVFLFIAILVALFCIVRNRKRRKRHTDENPIPTEVENEPNGNAPVSMYSQRCYEEIVEIQPILADNDNHGEVIYDNQNIIERGQEVVPLNEYASCDDSKAGSPPNGIYTESVNPYYKPSDEHHPPELVSDNPYYKPSVQDAVSPTKATEEPQYEDLNSVNPLYTPMSFAER